VALLAIRTVASMVLAVVSLKTLHKPFVALCKVGKVLNLCAVTTLPFTIEITDNSMITEEQAITLSELIELACIAREGMIQACYRGNLDNAITLKMQTQTILDRFIAQITDKQ
jgi:hypothetical protein